MSIASHPAEPDLNGDSTHVRHFVQEQRKIIANFRAQPWPLQMKLAARKYKQSVIDRSFVHTFSIDRAYQKNLSKYTNELNTLDLIRDYLQLVKIIIVYLSCNQV